MSYQTWEVHGYGIRVEDCIMPKEITWEKIAKLCQMAPNVLAQFSEDLRDYVSEELGLGKDEYPSYEKALQLVEEHQFSPDGFFIDYEPDFPEDYGIAGYLKAVINELEGLDLICALDFYNYYYVLIEPIYSWSHTTERTRLLTQDELREIFKKYLRIFTDKEVKLDYHQVQNGG